MTVTRTEVREEIEAALRHYATRADVSGMETRLVKWIVALSLGMFAFGISIGVFVQRLLE